MREREGERERERCFWHSDEVSTINETSQAEQGHTQVPCSPSSIWTQIIQQSSNLLGSLLLRPFSSKKS